MEIPLGLVHLFIQTVLLQELSLFVTGLLRTQANAQSQAMVSLQTAMAFL